MLGTAGIVLREAIGSYHTEWLLVAFAGILATAGIGITHRSLVAQILSRGAAWIVLFPSLVIAFFALARGVAPPFELITLAVGTTSALLLGRPMLHTDLAREAFAPKQFRRWFLAGSTATAATAFVTGGIALESLHTSFLTAGAFGVLTLSLLASAIGVVRMRAWGILLGAVTSLGLLVTAAFMGPGESIALALAAAPALLLHLLPVLIARLRDEPAEAIRVSSDGASASAFTAARYRVAVDPLEDEDDLEIDDVPRGEPARAAMRA